MRPVTGFSFSRLREKVRMRVSCGDRRTFINMTPSPQPSAAGGRGRRRRRRAHGYTLLEIAIVLLVVGLLTASALGAYNIYVQAQAQKETQMHATLSSNALITFLSQYGRYPCPARLDADRSDPDYGMETNCADTSIASGACANGVCIETSERTITPASGAPFNPRVRRGMLPFRQLNIPEDYAEDGYNARLEYAVTEQLAVVTTFEKTHGGIAVIDGQSPARSVVTPPATAHFMIISHGPDRRGAYTKYGRQTFACAGAGLDIENCNTAADGRAIYRAAVASTSGGAEHFDDIVRYYSSIETPLWKVSDGSGLNIHDLTKPGGVVGVGNPPAGSAYEVDGNMRAYDDPGLPGTTGRVNAQRFCDAAGGDCFWSEVIAGTYGPMQCPPGEMVTGIANNAVQCAPAPDVRCPPGQVMRGVNADRTLDCVPLISCPALEVDICNGTSAYTTRWLPTGRDGETATVTAGASMVDTYLCTGGAWQYQYDSGVCECVPENTTYTDVCPDPYTGTVTYNFIRTCPDGNETWTEIANACVCNPDSETATDACDPGYTGSRLYQRDFTCSNATTGSWGAWSLVSDTCLCTPDTDTQTIPCAPGYTGSIEQERNFTCPAATWSAWSDTSNSCACDMSGYEERTASCPAGYTGTIIERRNVASCGPLAWGPWYEYDRDCTLVTYSWIPTTSAIGVGSCPYGQRINSGCNTPGATSNCYADLGSSTCEHYPQCTCQ